MTICKNSLDFELSETQKKELSDHEERIDRKIKNDYVSGGEVESCLGCEREKISPKILDALKRRYKADRWRVSFFTRPASKMFPCTGAQLLWIKLS